MSRPWGTWFIFAICLLATTAAAAWLTHSAWRADQSRQQALLESEMRNTLWRLDSLAAPLLAIESNRPSLLEFQTDTPMLTPKLIKGYVVRSANGYWTIRRNGRGNQVELLTVECPLVREDWTARLGPTETAPTPRPDSTGELNPSLENLVSWPVPFPANFGPGAGPGMGPGAMPMNNSVAQEAQSRGQLVQQFQQITINSQGPPAPRNNTVPEARAIPLRPVWVGEELVFARQSSTVRTRGQEVIEICWLNWPEWDKLLTSQLTGSSVPLRLRPSLPGIASSGADPFDDWQMVSLPLRLELASPPSPPVWPRPLIAVWGLLVIVAIAFFGLMRQTLNLSERRAAFVSAVTHELRTPLTTFRLYTELLSEGIASDPEQQQVYFQTLHREANRLTHLVENVLAYARLEHGRTTARNETLTVAELFDRCRSRLEQRVAETPLSLEIDISKAAEAARLTTNAMAVEQILFNLIDNSCKYARDASDRRIRCEVAIKSGRLAIQVSDFGPGLSKPARNSLFQPFQKSSSQAAESAPGIGLGLALSRRLARELGGSLDCHPNVPQGLTFELALPLAGSGA
jgi:signal transduction histidine kinase